MATAAAKTKKIASMVRARASVAPESCGIIFRVIHPPRRAPTAKQISAMSDRESEEDDVASHVGRENMAERQYTYRVHDSGHGRHAEKDRGWRTCTHRLCPHGAHRWGRRAAVIETITRALGITYRENRIITKSLKFVSGPKGDVVDISSGRRLFQELAGVENAV